MVGSVRCSSARSLRAVKFLSIQSEQFPTAQIQGVQEQSVQCDVQVQLVVNATVQAHVLIMVQIHAQIQIKFKPKFMFKSKSEPSVSSSSSTTECTSKARAVFMFPMVAHVCYAHANCRLHVHVATIVHPDLILMVICLLHVMHRYACIPNRFAYICTRRFHLYVTACASPTPNASQDSRPSLR